MKEKLNQFEATIMQRVAIQYPSIKPHIRFLRVVERKNTGVGMYIYFVYSGEPPDLPEIKPRNDVLGTNENISTKSLKFGLGFVVSIIDGRIKFIELFTYEDTQWDGKTDDCHFEDLK